MGGEDAMEGVEVVLVDGFEFRDLAGGDGAHEG